LFLNLDLNLRGFGLYWGPGKRGQPKVNPFYTGDPVGKGEKRLSLNRGPSASGIGSLCNTGRQGRSLTRYGRASAGTSTMPTAQRALHEGCMKTSLRERLRHSSRFSTPRPNLG